MQVHVVAFAAARELIGSSLDLALPPGSRVRDAWSALQKAHPELATHATSMRLARNGRLAGDDEHLSDGDELAVLPPVGGG